MSNAAGNQLLSRTLVRTVLSTGFCLSGKASLQFDWKQTRKVSFISFEHTFERFQIEYGVIEMQIVR